MFVLSFHHVEPEPISHQSRKRWTITPNGLRNVIRVLRALDIEILSMSDFIQNPEQFLQPGETQKVILTFDDGYENFYQYAYPVMLQEKCPATIFVLAGKLAGTNSWDQGDLPTSERDKLLTKEQIEEMGRSQIITFGSHGYNHQDFTTLTMEELKKEIFDSHEVLKDIAGEAYFPVLAYPWGRRSERVSEVMHKSPYLYGFSTQKRQWKIGSAIYNVPRFDVYFHDSNPLLFVWKMLYHQLVNLFKILFSINKIYRNLINFYQLEANGTAVMMKFAITNNQKAS